MKPAVWQTQINQSGARVVWPIADLRDHDIDGPCWCQPYDDDGVMVHNSMDRREEFERGRKVS